MLSALSRLKPTPPPRSSNRMIAAGKRAVSDLNAARDKIEQKLETAKEEQALRDLLVCAKKMREICDTVFNKEQLKYALNTRLMLGLIKSYDKNVDSENDLHKALRDVMTIVYFGKLGKNLINCLDIIIRASSSLVDALDSAPRIKDYPDHRCVLALANQWLQIFGKTPTLTHLDKEDEGIRLFEPSPFHAFVIALPLGRPIKGETIRTAVEFIQTIARGVL